MKNKTLLCAKALAEILANKGFDQKKVVNNFVKFLVAAGLQNKSEEILEKTQELLLQKQGNQRIIFETARKIDTKNFMKSFVKKGDLVEEKINPALIAGIRITVNGQKQFDNSLVNKLNKI